MKKLLAVVFTVLVAASLSLAQKGAATGKARGGNKAPNNSSAREHNGSATNREHKRGNQVQKSGKKSKQTSSEIRKGWDLKKNTRK